MKSARCNAEYYAFTLTGDAAGRVSWGAQTHFLGWADKTHHVELREPSLVCGERMLKTWSLLGQPAFAVHDSIEFAIFAYHGGNAIVEEVFAKDELEELLTPSACVRLGVGPFVNADRLPEGALNRAPNPKLRMSVLKRDSCRCRICGRNPADDVDLELHVHHIRPWALGGRSMTSNLITLCHTCHRGLDPHFESSLFAMLPKDENTEFSWHLLPSTDDPGGHAEGVRHYRRIVWEDWERNRPLVPSRGKYQRRGAGRTSARPRR
jgi:hypothetical protein